MEPGIRPYAFGPFLLDTRERRLLRDGEVVPLTLKAFDLLQILVENRGHLLHKEELLRRVWPDAIVEENNLTVTISALRKALQAGPGLPGEHRVADVLGGEDLVPPDPHVLQQDPFRGRPGLGVEALDAGHCRAGALDGGAPPPLPDQ